MLCNCCEHRRRNIEDKQNKVPHPRQPRCECGSDFSVRGCYMFKPMELPVMQGRKGDRRPIGGPAMIAARVGADRLANDTGVFLVPYGPKKNREFVYVRRPLTKEEKRAIIREEKENAKWLKKVLTLMKRDRIPRRTSRSRTAK